MTRALCIAFALAACTSSSNGNKSSPDGGTARDGGSTSHDGSVDAGGTTTPGGPEFLSFGTNITTMTESDTVTFVAVLTDPQGLVNLVGGHLTDPTGQIQFGAFTATNQGSYSLSLTWPQIYQATSFQFVGQGPAKFVAEFFDVQGRNTTKDATLTLACQASTWGTCGGTCYDFANDSAHCGGCGTCSSVSSNTSCASGACAVNVEDASDASSCMATCAAANGTCATACQSFDSFASVAEYTCTNQSPMDFGLTCSDVPPATESSCPITDHVCCCGIVPAD
jgi:hypothetical protein